jgi:DNA-binding transcriptional LysR family regulator
MKIPSNSLEAFLEVARSGQFTKAAANLHLTQSALSQRILNLEKLLGLTLFVRDRSGPRLTPEGERLLQHAQTLESLEAEFLGEDEIPEGSVRVAGFSSVTRSLVIPALAPLLREFPVSCEIFTRELHAMPELLRRGEADFILVDQELPREDWESIFLGFEENVLVRGKRHTITHCYLDHDAEDSVTARYFSKGNAKGKKLNRRFLDDVYGLIDGVKLGIGEAVLPRHLISGEKDLEILQPEKCLRLPVWLHFPSQPYYTRLQKRVREALVHHFTMSLPQK